MALSPSWFQEWSPPLNVYQPEQYHQSYPEFHFQNAPPNKELSLPPYGYIGDQIDYLHQSPQYYPQFPSNPFLSKGGNVNNSNVLRLLPPLAWLSVSALSQQGIPSSALQADPFRPTVKVPPRSPVSTIYEWNVIDFQYGSPEERRIAIGAGLFIPENVLPLGLEVWDSRIFVTFPRWKPGVPATLATIPRSPKLSDSQSPLMKPFPDWTYHQPRGDCSGLTSVFRIAADNCGNLWVLDSGQIEALTKPQQLCPPQLFQFDLKTDRLVARHVIPDQFVKENSLFSNVVVDSRKGDCSDLHVYIADVWRFGLLVFRARDRKFWRFTNHLFYPDPLASDFTLHGINFQWSDGIFGMALSPIENNGDRTMYFHSMSGYREFTVPTSFLRDESNVENTAGAFAPLGESRGIRGQSSASAVDKQGVLFFNLVSLDALGCWDIRKPYKRDALGIAARNNVTMVFPNDLKIDRAPEQSVWFLTNRLPTFLYSKLDLSDVNFRILSGKTRNIVQGTICDPAVPYQGDPYTIDVCN